MGRTFSQAAGAAERSTEILAERPAIAPPANPKPLPASGKGAIFFDDVTFAYPARPDLPALHGVTFQVKPGETVAIVGPSGAGKSTVFSLILRFYDPDSGKVVDRRRRHARGRSGGGARRASRSCRRTSPSLPPACATISPSAGRAPPAPRSRQAAQDALADEFIRRLDNGFDTQVGERGVTLSGGQRQRIAIARAILRDAPILLLDEATSALDAGSETLVQTALERLMQGRTTIVIAHRLATVLNADRILVMDQAASSRKARTRAWCAKGGIYAGLAKLQFETGASAFRAPRSNPARTAKRRSDRYPLAG